MPLHPPSTPVLTAVKAKTMSGPSSTPAPSTLKPAKSILKPVTSHATGQKRKRMDIDLSSPSSNASPEPSSAENRSTSPRPKKRARVKFEIDLYAGGQQQQQSDEIPEKSIAVVREEVRRAIQRHLAGDSETYDRVKEVFTADPKQLEDDGTPVHSLPSHTSLKNHLMGLFSNVSALDGACSGLVHAVLASEWLGRDESYVKLYVRFLGTLAAARGGYLNAVLKMLVGGLRQVPPAVRKLRGYPVVRTSDIYARTHMAIQYILQLIPAGSGAISPILSSSFPQGSDSVKAHVAYTRNLIKIVDYAPELRSDILALITEKLVKIDVQTQVDLEDFDEEMEEDIVHSLSTPETIALEDEDDSDTESSLSDEESEDGDAEQVKKVKDYFYKIDYMMDILFEYYAASFTSGNVGDTENALDLLLAHFQNIILPTYRSRHSQFLLFHYSQSSPILIDRFATTCVQIIFSKSQPTIIRQYAAAYLASFVARGAHVSSEVVRDVFDLLGTHLQNLRSEYEPSCRGPDLRRYGPFYSTAQALLYIFCFRWRDLTTAALEEDGPDALNELELDDVSFPPVIKELLHSAIYSKLNPLKICSPLIVEQFVRIVHHLGFLYVAPLLEMNKRLRISSFRSLSSMALESRFGHVERETKADDDLGPQLDAYFPFDPYHPRRSRRWIEGDYIEWDDIALVTDHADGHDDTDNSLLDDVEIEDKTGTDDEYSSDD